MAVTCALLRPNMHRGVTAKEHVHVPRSTHPFVCRTDVKTATTAPADPYATVLDTAANGLKHRIIPCADFSFLDLFLLASGAGAVSTTLKVRCFGWRRWGDPQSARQAEWPSDIDSTNFDDPLNATIAFPLNPDDGTKTARGLWVPLYRPSDGAHILEFVGTPEITKSSTSGGAKVFNVTGSTVSPTDVAHVDVSGCEYAIALIQTALVGPTAGLLCGILRSGA